MKMGIHRRLVGSALSLVDSRLRGSDGNGGDEVDST